MTPMATSDMADMLANAGAACDFLKKLANPNRLMIACALVEGERSVAELEEMLSLHQPALSQQIAELREAGLIAGRRESKSVFYRLADDRVAALVGLLHRMFCQDAVSSLREMPPTNDNTESVRQ